ncbi:class II D-tagatose-bisphosphate aldolase, non-catalytic subunit [uncultured Clostridium sp.]|uniref:class II D-tagatose-bisphosphate aldolase, non-catalytic subunit n=1 Tax=uncultured Clostridium sp. TaxID=59620 RepID=UPI0028EF5D14|nr:class II D-tagatose-bisphosphate aldolase, non-catalytic subunit [uncultured Clostridium sp.]
MSTHPIINIIKNHKSGKHDGIFSVCCSNKFVIEAAMDKIRGIDMYLLVEATANQVDQFGGYTGMIPKEYRDFIYKLCEKNDFPKEKVILGGDHLGPLTWRNIDPVQALENSKELIRQYVMAGFTKIHIDTSMQIKGDAEDEKFGDEIIAERAAILCKMAEEAYLELLEKNKEAIHPVYIIGSEVPIPGGAQVSEEEEGMQITKVEDFENTVKTFKEAFERHGIQEVFEDVIGVVVQPGVEFGSTSVWEYDREKASDISNTIKKYDKLVFEAHSTDYQTKEALRSMVEDGFIILKVGPALTFGFREGMFALNDIENELFRYNSDFEVSRFREILDFVMVKNPSQWEKHYNGSGEEIKLERKYSMSDRCRYYMPNEEVEFALNKVMDNLSNIDIPLTLISQYMHTQYLKIREGKLKPTPYELLKDRIGEYIDDYIYAIKKE